jgi:hypothetical protein
MARCRHTVRRHTRPSGAAHHARRRAARGATRRGTQKSVTPGCAPHSQAGPTAEAVGPAGPGRVKIPSGRAVRVSPRGSGQDLEGHAVEGAVSGDLGRPERRLADGAQHLPGSRRVTAGHGGTGHGGTGHGGTGHGGTAWSLPHTYTLARSSAHIPLALAVRRTQEDRPPPRGLNAPPRPTPSTVNTALPPRGLATGGAARAGERKNPCGACSPVRAAGPGPRRRSAVSARSPFSPFEACACGAADYRRGREGGTRGKRGQGWGAGEEEVARLHARARGLVTLSE